MRDLWDILDESMMTIPTNTLNNEVVRRNYKLKSRKVLSIIQVLIDGENYLHIHDIKELNKVWDILMTVQSSSSKMKHHKQIKII